LVALSCSDAEQAVLFSNHITTVLTPT